MTKALRLYAKDEILSHYLYRRMAKYSKHEANKGILQKIANDELNHFHIFNSYLADNPVKEKVNRLSLFFFSLMFFILGVTFTVKLLQNKEDAAQKKYGKYVESIPEIKAIIDEEEEHENALIALLNEERLKYVSSMVLGLNDALVEISGALAGYTFAIQNSFNIAIVGLITGISATLSMAASEYLSSRQEGDQDALKAALYTGTAYIVVLTLLILPYFFITNYFVALGVMISVVIFIVLFFNFYISIAKDQSFKKNFLSMSILALVIASISFVLGYVLNQVFGISV